MSINYRLKSAMEAIAFQKDFNFFKELSEALGRVRSIYKQIERPYALNRSFSDAEIEAFTNVENIVFEHTRIKILFRTTNDSFDNAHVAPPLLANNDVLRSAYLPIFSDYPDAMFEDAVRLVKNKIEMVGTVDIIKGTVGGVFSKIVIPIWISTNTVVDDYYSDEENAASILHETGHIFGYFEYIASTVTKNLAIVGLTEYFFSDHNFDQTKVEFISRIKKGMALTDLNTAAAESAKNKEELQIVIFDAVKKSVRSETGLDFYDYTTWEYIADQYCTRLGGGTAFVTSLHKLEKRYGSSYLKTKLAHRIGAAIDLIGITFISIATFGVMAVLILSIIAPFNLLYSKYDKPKDRYIRIKQQLLLRLSNETNAAIKKKLLDEVKVINEIITETHNHESVLEYLSARLTSSRRNELSQTQLQKDLETIGMSDLFATAARINTL